MKDNNHTQVIDLYGIKWEVHFVPSGHLAFAETPNRMGVTYEKRREIYVANDMNELAVRDTLIHELSHAVIVTNHLCKQEYTQEELCLYIDRYAYDLVRFTNEILEVKNNGN